MKYTNELDRGKAVAFVVFIVVFALWMTRFF